MKNRALVIVFLVVQLGGVVCSWLWQHPYSGASSFLWGTGLVALLPGNILGTWVVQGLLWHTPSTLGTMSVIALFLGVAINAVVWLVIVKVFQRVFGRRVSVRANRLI